MGPEAERPGGGLVEKKRSNVDVDDQGNVSDDQSWQGEKDEVVDATKFSTVRKSLTTTQLWAPDLTRLDLVAKTPHCRCGLHMHFQWKPGVLNALGRS